MRVRLVPTKELSRRETTAFVVHEEAAAVVTTHEDHVRRRWYGLALLCALQFMVVLDVAIVNVALPSIQVDLGFSQENLQWVLSAYALAFGGFLLLGGRAADLVGAAADPDRSARPCSRSARCSAGSRGATTR